MRTKSNLKKPIFARKKAGVCVTKKNRQKGSKTFIAGMAPSALSLRDGKRAPRFLKAPRRIMFTVHIFAEMHKERAIFPRDFGGFSYEAKNRGGRGT